MENEAKKKSEELDKALTDSKNKLDKLEKKISSQTPVQQEKPKIENATSEANRKANEVAQQKLANVASWISKNSSSRPEPTKTSTTKQVSTTPQAASKEEILNEK